MPVRTAAVTAVLVSHDGARWLPEVLAALAAQSVRPGRVVCADTGSSDDSAVQLRNAFGAVLVLPPATGYGAAVAAALATIPADTDAADTVPTDQGWIWLLHDDVAPAPDALEALLAYATGLADATGAPSAVLLGPKVCDWSDPRVLVEVGLTTDGGGHRRTGLEPGEHDQGQHDSPRDVLAVGTAGALVRRDVWDAVGGLDPELPVFRDDLDLGWRVNAAGHRVVVVPTAVVRHARAATTGQRSLDAAPGRPGGVDRRHALHVLLAHAAGPRLLAVLPRLVLACLLRTVGFLLTRQPLAARDEMAALAAVLAQPGRLHAARRTRATTRAVPPSALRPLLASATAPMLARIAALADWAAGGAPFGRGVGEQGAEERPAGLPAVLRRPGILLVLALALVALLAERRLLGGGVLAGGRLLPAPAGASELWTAYAESGPPSLAMLAVLSTVLFGKAWLAVDLLLLASVPAAGAVAYAVSGQVVRSTVLRLWAAATWALLPVATGAVAAGRLDAAVVQVALPALLLGGRVVASRDPRHGGWSHAWAVGLALAVVVAFAPVLLPLVAVFVLGAAVLAVVAGAPAQRPAARRRALGCLVAALVPLLVLLPWPLTLLADPGALLHGPGRLGPGLAESDLPGWHLLLLSPGGPGVPGLALSAGLLLGALGALARTRRARLAAAGWALALAGLAYALLLARTTASGVPVWPGAGLQVAAAGMLLAAVVGADGLGERLGRSEFGRRQLTAWLLVAVAAVVPVLCAADWLVGGADGPLRRGDVSVLPAFARAELEASPRLHALVLSPRLDGSVGYALTGPDGVRLGQERPVRLDDVVADLLSPRGSDAAGSLAARAVGFVALTGDRPDAVAALDAQAGLAREVGGRPLLWRVTAPASAFAPAPPDPTTPGWQLTLQAVALLVVAVLAGPGVARRRGLEIEGRP